MSSTGGVVAYYTTSDSTSAVMVVANTSYFPEPQEPSGVFDASEKEHKPEEPRLPDWEATPNKQMIGMSPGLAFMPEGHWP